MKYLIIKEIEEETPEEDQSFDNDHIVGNSLWENHGTFVGQVQRETNRMKGLRELEDFLNTPVLPIQADALEYWRQNMGRYPCLSEIAKRIMGTMPSSVPSERLFSRAGLIMTKKRNRLSTEHFSQLLFLSKCEYT